MAHEFLLITTKRNRWNVSVNRLANTLKIMIIIKNMVGVAQLVEHWVVAPAVAGSNPVTHPIKAIFHVGVYISETV